VNPLFIDYETRSTVELRRTGVYPYAAHRDTFIWCMAYAYGDGPVQQWIEGDIFPPDVARHITFGGEVWAWNAQFERVMWRDCARRVYGWPELPDAQVFDIAADAAAMALPRKLELCAAVLGLDVRKDTEGAKVMQQLCRPKTMSGDEPVWHNDPVKLQRLYLYNRRDIEVERAVFKRTRRLPPHERLVYLLDQTINDRGVYLDRDLAAAVRKGAESEVARQNALLAEATGGALDKTTRLDRLKEWLAAAGGLTDENGAPLASLDKAALRELLDEGVRHLSPEVRAALEARREASKSSVAKTGAMFDCVSLDARMRGLLLYHGAHTGRWSGKLVQPQNFPRALDVERPESYISAVLRGEPQRMSVYAALLKPMLTAAPGRELYCADFAGIESRVVGWLADDANLLGQYTSGKSPYKETAAFIYGVNASEIVKPSERYQLGKMTVLGCGFGMGAEKFAKQVKEQAGVDLPPHMALRAVSAYREIYAAVPQYWFIVNACAVDAVSHPYEVFTAGSGSATVRFTARNGFLWIVLPSGRPLAYYEPRVIQRAVPWNKNDLRPAVQYSGYNTYTRQWERLALYGGLITENIVQAVARDLLANAMLRVEDAGYPVVLTVHDEIVSEVPIDTLGPVFKNADSGSFEDFLALMHVVPEWADGLPIAAEGWHGPRYKK